MDGLIEFKFNYIYELANIIDDYVKYAVSFFNYNEDYFINASKKFSKDTLLHLYIVTTAMNHYHRDFRKNGDLIDEESIKKWYSLFESYNIIIEKFCFDDENEIIRWFDTNINKFEELFDEMAKEVFYLLFQNRLFLLNFNNLTIETVNNTIYQKNNLTSKGRLKRVSIPKWVKNAVFHRDKGRCVFCNKDLTGLINTLTKSNYDHIVPLDLYGTNDPCNIQLTCERCNKSKNNKVGVTSSKYAQWWSI